MRVKQFSGGVGGWGPPLPRCLLNFFHFCAILIHIFLVPQIQSIESLLEALSTTLTSEFPFYCVSHCFFFRKFLVTQAKTSQFEYVNLITIPYPMDKNCTLSFLPNSFLFNISSPLTPFFFSSVIKCPPILLRPFHPPPKVGTFDHHP